MACKKKQQQSGSKFRPKRKVKVSPNELVTINMSFSTPIIMPESSSANDFESASVITPSRSFLDKNGTPPLSCDSPSTSGQELDHSCSNVQSAEQQILEDSQLAQMLQEWENTSNSFQEINNCSTTVVADTSQIVKILSERVDRMQEFFLFHDAVHPFQGRAQS